MLKRLAGDHHYNSRFVERKGSQKFDDMTPCCAASSFLAASLEWVIKRRESMSAAAAAFA
jgi:hypothetical protein